MEQKESQKDDQNLNDNIDEMDEALNQLDDKLNLTAGEDDIKGILVFILR